MVIEVEQRIQLRRYTGDQSALSFSLLGRPLVGRSCRIIPHYEPPVSNDGFRPIRGSGQSNPASRFLSTSAWISGLRIEMNEVTYCW